MICYEYPQNHIEKLSAGTNRIQIVKIFLLLNKFSVICQYTPKMIREFTTSYQIRTRNKNDYEIVKIFLFNQIFHWFFRYYVISFYFALFLT
jgi:hypothetical protein